MTTPSIWQIGGDDVRLRIPLLKRLRAEGLAVAACGTESPEPFDEAHIPYYRYRLSRSVDPLTDYRSIKDLTRIFTEHRPDLVHAFDTKPNLVAPIAARRAGVRCVVNTITGMGRLFMPASLGARLLRPVLMGVQRYIDRFADITVFQNSQDMKIFLRRGIVTEGKARLIRGSGVDIEDIATHSPSAETVDGLKNALGLSGKTVVTMISRVIREKGVIEFLEAAELVAARREDVRFILVGPRGSEGRQAIPETTIRRYSNVVDYLGARKDVPAILCLTDLLVLPTKYGEGVPRVLLEAGALGIALVATDAPGCEDVVRSQWNGLIVPHGKVAPLAEAIDHLVDQRDVRRLMGERSRALVSEEFSLEKVARGYLSIYRELLDN